MCQGEFLKKDEDQWWDLYEDLAEKQSSGNLIQISLKIRIQQLPKLDSISIESSIAAEAKLTHLMRRLELLEAKEQGMVNQVNPLQMTNPGYTYCHALNHVFKECPVYLAQQMLPDNMNSAFSRPNNNPYSKIYKLGWRNHPNFSWS